MPDDKLVFHNNMPIFGWIFMPIWIAMLVAITWQFVRDGGLHQNNSTLLELAMIVLFWLAGLAGCVKAFATPRVQLTIADGSVELLERWAYRIRVERFPLAQLSAPTLLAEERDSESGPYFRCTITTPSGRTISFSEHNDRAAAEATRNRLISAMP